MRHVLLPAVAAVVLAVPATAQDGRGQPVRYWPRRDISFPVPPEVLQRDPKPARLRLYSAPVGGAFQLAVERPANGLDPIPGDPPRPPGFRYTAKADGEEEFAVQLVYDDGTVSPPVDKLRTEFRVVFDSRPPTVQLVASGAYGVEWSAADENLDSSSIRLQCRWAGDQKWFEPKSRTSFRARDTFTWPSLARDTRTLEVRVIAKDLAEHEGYSRIVRLPSNPSSGGLAREFGDPLVSMNGNARAGDPTGEFRNSRNTGEDVPGQPQIIYANTTQLMIRSKLNHVTRSGVRAVHLFAKEMTTGAAGEWKEVKTQACDPVIKFEAPDQVVEIPYAVPKDGRYGFIVVPESGVGRRGPDPRPATPPHHLVEVDTIPPTVKIRNVTVTPGGAIGPRVEIEWDADDRNLMPDPIVLEYAPTKDAKVWTSIAEKVPNSRRYVWEVSDKVLYKFYVRLRAVDKAANTGEHVYEKEVIIDLDHPSATIEHIKPSGNGGAGRTPVITPDGPGKLPDVSPLSGK
jgi:hypothetical protein